MADGPQIPQYFAQRKPTAEVGEAKMPSPSFHAGREAAAFGAAAGD